MERDNLETVRRCMGLLPAAQCSYQEWLHVGMVLRDEGGDVSEWDAWSRTDARYRDGECARKWRGFGRNHEKVSVGTVVDYVKAHGLWVSAPRQEIPDDAPALDWGDAIPDYTVHGAAAPIVRAEYIVPAAIRAPGDEWDQLREMADYLDAVFDPGDRVSYCVKAYEGTRKDGSTFLRPANSGNASHTAGELVSELRRYHAKGERRDVGAVIGDYNQEAGVWIRVNGVQSSDGTDATVSGYANALVECDSKTPEEQLAIIRKLNLPCAAIVHSGGKSIHAVVKIQATTEREYQQRVDRLFKECEKAGLPLDRQNRNPSRYSRLPGVVRGGKRQFLIAVDCGARSWEAWLDWLEEQTDDLPEIVSAADFIDNPPPLADELIEGILRKGHKMLVTGPSKAGKSYLLLELAIAVANGAGWLGFRCAKGKALYINLEISPSSDRTRVAELWKAGAYPKENQRNLFTWDLRGHARSFEKLAPLIIRRVKSIPGLSCIILDPIYKVITGDENKAEEMGRFCNFFDYIAEQCRCSMIYCHHHSKGAQGDKKAQDRASGSGVFARDPDALLDMIELEVDDRRRKTVADRLVCDRLSAALDARHPTWRQVIGQDDALKADTLLEAARQWLGEEADSIAGDARLRMERATAWRFDGILREFPPIRPVNAWFVWPVHQVDDSGILADVLMDGQTRPKKAQRQPSKKEQREAQLADFALVFDSLVYQGKTTLGNIAHEMKIDEREVNRLARASGEFIVENKVVRRKNSEDND